jgi:hypothetical protein
MEGSWRGPAAWLAAAAIACGTVVAATGCGDDETRAAAAGSVHTASPEKTFAPLLQLAADEPWRPVGAGWFIARSSLWFAEDRGCADRKIAVGRELPEQQNATIYWIFLTGLGDGPEDNYYRSPYGVRCRSNIDVRVYADEPTRPHDPGPRRDGVRSGQGYYLSLADGGRPGTPIAAEARAPVYVERTDEGDGGVRLTYWLLFGMHGMPGAADSHEGDWERVDVLLSDLGDDVYQPLGVQLEGVGATHPLQGKRPVVRLAPGTHEPTLGRCRGCVPWRSWRLLEDARDQPWYGFGGAWGEPGRSDATTGPLGPHRFWPTVADKQREAAG